MYLGGLVAGFQQCLPERGGKSQNFGLERKEVVNVLVNILGTKSIQNVKPGLKFPCSV